MARVLLLNLGPYVQALSCFGVLWLARLRRRRHLVGMGALTGVITALAWYLLVRAASGSAEVWSQVFDPNAALPAGLAPGMVRAGLQYHALFSPFIGVLVGAFLGDLRWRSLQDGSGVLRIPVGSAPGAPEFLWSSALTYLVLFRLAQGLAGAVVGREAGARDGFLLQLAGWGAVLGCTLAASAWLWVRTPETRRQAISRARRASVALIAAASVLPLGVGLVPVAAGVFMTALVTLNAVGFLWGTLIGDLRWRHLEISATASTPDASAR